MSGSRAFIGMAILAVWLAHGMASGNQAGKPAAPARQPVSGEDIYRYMMFDEWWVAAYDRQGHVFHIEILPNGRFQAANMNGGGAVVGQWLVDQPANQLCLNWDRRAQVADGCYEVMRTGVLTYELVDPPSRVTAWWFVVSDEIH